MSSNRESRRANKLARLEACRRANSVHRAVSVIPTATIDEPLFEYFYGTFEDPNEAKPGIRSWLDSTNRSVSLSVNSCSVECARSLHSECDFYSDSLNVMRRTMVVNNNIHTYVALDRRGNFKFGKARDPIGRLAGAGTWFSEEADQPRLLGFCHEDSLSESDVHYELQRHSSRSEREWFRPCEDTFAMAKRICQLGSDTAASVIDFQGYGDHELEAIAWYQYALDLDPQADVYELVLEILSYDEEDEGAA